MQTAARLDFIGLPRLRGCGGSVFLCWKENWGGGCGLCRRGWGWCEAGLWGRELGLARGCELWGARLDLVLGRRENFNSPLSARGCSPLSPKGKARGVKNKERPLLFAEADSFPRWGKQGERLEMEWCCYLNFKSKMTCAPHHLASQGASPQGEALERGKILIVLYRLADARHFPRRGKQGA